MVKEGLILKKIIKFLKLFQLILLWNQLQEKRQIRVNP